jgi:hypothetical protein
MSNKNSSRAFELYLANIKRFAKSVVIKFDQIAQAINYSVVTTHGLSSVNYDDKRTWKYYQNISGAYHFSDEHMLITSLDNTGTIVFSKENLITNPVTAGAYIYDSYYYNELLARYPKQEMLILGILYPCDINNAIAAKDGTIVSYPVTLVEDNEIRLISDVQEWVYYYIRRWVNQQYTLNNNLYVVAYYAQLILLLIPAIVTIRLRYCKTSQAHSFHIYQYLKSCGLDEADLIELDRNQILNLYRNIKYYRINAGSNATFSTLCDVLLNSRGFPAYAYEFQQRSESIFYTTASNTTNIASDPIFIKKSLDKVAATTNPPKATLDQALSLIELSTIGNEEFQANNLQEIKDSFTYPKTGRAQTKVVETTLDQTKQTYVQAPEAVVYNEWVRACLTGKYAYTLIYTPPGASTTLTLTPEMAVALWHYAFLRVMKPIVADPVFSTDLRFPRIRINQIFKTTLPSLADLRSIVTRGVVSDSEISDILNLVPVRPAIILTPEQLENYCSSVFTAMKNINRYCSAEENPTKNMHLRVIASALFEDKIFQSNQLSVTTNPYVGKKYAELLAQIGFNPINYSSKDFYNLALDLLKRATGLDLSYISNPSNIRRSMVNILAKLTSYSVLFANTLDADNAYDLARGDVRATMYNWRENDRYRINVASLIGTFAREKEIAWTHISYSSNPKMNSAILKSVLVANVGPAKIVSNSKTYTVDSIYRVNNRNAFQTSFDTQALFAGQFAKLTDVQKQKFLTI